MGSDFTRHCARLVIRIARSSSPSNVLPFHRMILLCMFTIIQIVNIHNKVGERDEGRACT